MAMSQSSLHILGAGSIGMLFAKSIRSKIPSYPVTLLVRGNHRRRQHDTNEIHIECIESWNAEEKGRTKSETSPVIVPVEFVQGRADDAELPRVHNLLVTTKSYQAVNAIDSILPRLTVNNKEENQHEYPVKVILLCNGALSVKELLEHRFHEDVNVKLDLVLATTTHGVYQEQIEHINDNDPPFRRIIHAGYGQTFIEDSAQSIGTLWNDVGLNCQCLCWTAMQTLLWKKLAANCVINPLTAIHHCANGELLLEPSFPVMQEKILSEIAQVATETNVDNCEINRFSTDDLLTFVTQVIHDTRANRSSMYQDVVIHGQRTEIDHLNGFVIRKGKEMGIECPANEELYEQIHDLTRNYY